MESWKVFCLPNPQTKQGSKFKKNLWSALGDQLEKYSRQRQIFSRQFV